MLIANPIYDIVFKFLMQDLEIARKILSVIISKDIVELRFAAQEHVVAKEDSPHGLTLFRIDFTAVIRLEDNRLKKVMLEVQKAKLSTDVVRFREYLGQRYREVDEFATADGEVSHRPLPVVAVFILGFSLEEGMPQAVHIGRYYRNMLTNENLLIESEFGEQLSHDVYLLQVRNFSRTYESPLERILAVLSQADFADDAEHWIEFPEMTFDDELTRRMVRKLADLRQSEEVRAKMKLEDEMYSVLEMELRERTTQLKMEIKKAKQQAEEAQRREEEERRQKEEARRREEEARRREEEARRQRESERLQREQVLERALAALAALGLSPEEARSQLGLGPPSD